MFNPNLFGALQSLWLPFQGTAIAAFAPSSATPHAVQKHGF
jgi:hypothetical protein